MAFLDEVSVAGNVSFVDEDLDRFEQLSLILHCHMTLGCITPYEVRGFPEFCQDVQMPFEYTGDIDRSSRFALVCELVHSSWHVSFAVSVLQNARRQIKCICNLFLEAFDRLESD